MATLYSWSNGFETGAHGASASSGTLIDWPHYTELARQGMAPFRGAYCQRIRLAGGTTSQYIQESTASDVIDATETWYFGWYFYLGKDMVFGATDKFSMVEFESTEDTVDEVAAGIIIASGIVQFWFNEAIGTASPSVIDLGAVSPTAADTALGKWYHAELKIVLDPGANDGTLDGYITREGGQPIAGTQITSLDQADIVDFRFGALGVDAGTSGTLLMDDAYLDTARIYAVKNRFTPSNKRIVHASDHPIIGPGCFSVAFTSGGTDGVLTMYDTDGIPTNLDNTIGPPIRNISALEMVPGHDVFECHFGLYTVMTGTTAPQASISIERGGVCSQGGYVTRGAATKRPQGV